MQREGVSDRDVTGNPARTAAPQRGRPALSTIGERYAGRQNNFDFLRFVAAFLVILSHSTPLSGLKVPEPLMAETNGQFSLGRVGVIIFFFLSGFLITGSYMSAGQLGKFLKARLLRIFPGLFVVLLLTVLVMGPLVTDLPVREYFASHRTWDYLWLNGTLYTLQWDLPGVFQHNGYPGAINGSLWTLPLEFTYYLLVAALGLTGLLKRRSVVVGLVAASLIIGTRWGSFYNELFPYFGAGMIVYLFRAEIPLSASFAAVSLGCLALAAHFGGLGLVTVAMGCYLVFWLAFNRRLPLSQFARYGDFSYGLYIYAFPVQQLITYLFGGTMNPWLNFALAAPTTLGCAALSWHLVEKRCLKLKNVPLFGWVTRFRAKQVG